MIDILFAMVVLQLGDQSWQEREKAHSILTKGLPYSENALRCGLKNNDPEIAIRCKSILIPKGKEMPYVQLKPGKLWIPPPIEFIHESVFHWNGFDFDKKLYLDAATKLVGGNGPPHWPASRVATLLFIDDMIMNWGLDETIGSLREFILEAEEKDAMIRLFFGP